MMKKRGGKRIKEWDDAERRGGKGGRKLDTRSGKRE